MASLGPLADESITDLCGHRPTRRKDHRPVDQAVEFSVVVRMEHLSTVASELMGDRPGRGFGLFCPRREVVEGDESGLRGGIKGRGQ